MERAAVFAVSEFQVGAFRLLQGEVFGEGDDAFQPGTVFFEAVQEETCQLLGGDLAALD